MKRKTAAYNICCKRWSENAGRPFLAYADGKDKQRQIEKFKDAGGLFISYLTNPTTGGVSASFASLGDIIIAEPGALICFAGPRVIEQTIGQKLPEGFQHSEFLLEHGMIDMIVDRKDMKQTLSKILKMHVNTGGEA